MTVDETMWTVAPARAAEELELRREEFRLAVRLGLIRTIPPPGTGAETNADADVGAEGTARGRPGNRDGAGGGAGDPSEVRPRVRPRARSGGWEAVGWDQPPERRPVERAEIDRLKAAPDFPAGLRDRVRAVGAGEAAALLSVAPTRFARLVRTGHLSPVRFYLNRYRSVIWLYVAAEVTAFGEAHPELLTGRLPVALREREAAGEDLRARNWRSRHLALLLRGTADPWARAAAIASLLDPDRLAETVDDPHERALLDRLRPAPPPGLPLTGTARETAERLLRADGPDEIRWHRTNLTLALAEARAARPAPTPSPAPAPVPEEQPLPRAAPPRGAAPQTAPAYRPPGRPRARNTHPPGGPSRPRRPGLLERLRRSLPGGTAAGGWKGRRDWG